MRSRQTNDEYWSDFLRIQEIKDEVDKVMIMPECRWKKIKLNLNFQCSLSTFFNNASISQSDIINAIISGKFFGLVKVKITTPEDIIKKYESLNMPFIFDKRQVEVRLLILSNKPIFNHI